ncbi:MAG: nonstructural protein [Microviridae sp.]|nr:MAG: nonstructural protein [Microviridae sp.]
MKSVVLAMLDVKVGQFNSPLTFPNRAVASRAIKDACAPDSDFAKHPEDYQFYVIGEYESDDGSLSPLYPPELFFSAKDFV